MKTLYVEYLIEKYINVEIEVSDEVYAQFKKTGDESLLDIDLGEIHRDCEREDAKSDYAISDEDFIPIIKWQSK